MFQNTKIKIAEVNQEKAWISLNEKLNQSSQKSFIKIKIAVAIAVLVILSITTFLLYDSTPSMMYVVSADQQKQVIFPDGSIGILNKNSSLTYPKKFGSKRTISFTGEVFFDIKKSKKPFVIDANEVNIVVLGTAFNLINTDTLVKLYVDRGLVAFEKGGIQTKVSAGNEALFIRKDASIKIKPALSKNNLSWKNGFFIFNNTPLKIVLNEFSTYYGVTFEFSNKNLNKCRLSATFNRQPLSKVLKTISTTLKIRTSTKKNIVKISGQGC